MIKKTCAQGAALMRSACLMLVGSIVVACASGTKHAAMIDAAKRAPTASERGADPISELELRKIAAEYKSWGRVNDVIRWAPDTCFPEPMIPKAAEDRPGSPHTQKLYYLYAADPVSYMFGQESPQPEGQVVVKESFREAEVMDAVTVERGHDDNIAIRDRVRWRTGDPDALFVMRRYAEDDRGSSGGWRFAAITHDGTHILSNGNSKNCIECHETAPHHGLYGVEWIPNVHVDLLQMRRGGGAGQFISGPTRGQRREASLPRGWTPVRASEMHDAAVLRVTDQIQLPGDAPVSFMVAADEFGAMLLGRGDKVDVFDMRSGSQFDTYSGESPITAAAAAPELGRAFFYRKDEARIEIINMLNGCSIGSIPTSRGISMIVNGSIFWALCLNASDGTVTAFRTDVDPCLSTVVNEIPLGGRACFINAMDGLRVFVALRDTREILLLDCDASFTIAERRQSPLDAPPVAIAMDRDRNHMSILCENGTLARLDATGRMLGRTRLDGHVEHGLLSLPDGRVVVTTEDGRMMLFSVDKSGNFAVQASLSIPSGRHILAFAPDPGALLVSCSSPTGAVMLKVAYN